ncbi:hypothetical protein F4775DRAFT_605704 [Biscogniauxia sp. FL1348]|nr:hypothetical protein F4775DRAFT_605704 [Biscogniauxia sp. FL1348]
MFLSQTVLSSETDYISLEDHSTADNDSFTFIIGEEQSLFSVDPAPFAKVSEVFSEKIHHPAAGAKPHEAELPDLDFETFAALKDYVYTGDYTTPWAEERAQPVRYAVEDLPPEGQEAWAAERVAICRTDTGYRQRYADDKREFKEVLADHKAPAGAPPHEPEDMGLREMDYAPVFLCHAKLYFAGQKYRVGQLAALALHKLCRTVEVWVDWYEGLPDLVVLLKYVSDMAAADDPMRDMLLDFVALKFSDYQYHPLFMGFLQTNSQFLAETTCRIAAAKDRTADILGDYREDDYKAYSIEKVE